ncbi:MAG: alanine:cation symporter family protein [Pseudobdellovibrionaceae bacterium]|nr:MAG: alanine:cation symporter family protein [Pseudobdellovibrionaceae bacterium]
MVVVLVGTGLALTLLLGFVQIKGFIHAIHVIRGRYDDPNDPGEISHFQALTTALSATVGLGNIAGVAVAISAGGPGAVFWMVVTGLVGMATKYSECSLAVMYRHVDERGEVHGGPMHYIVRGLGEKWRPLAVFFAFAAIVASFGAANMFQTNQVASVLVRSLPYDENLIKWVTGITLSLLTGMVIIGGIKRIGHVTGILVPLMGAIYVIGALIVIVSNIGQVPAVFSSIFSEAFGLNAAAGGVAGGAIRALIQGVRRACFSNEAGLGSAPIAHSAASTDEPIREGVVALLEPFIDTVVICSMTALVILISGAHLNSDGVEGVTLTAAAFDTGIPGFGTFFVTTAVVLFAYSTLLSWSYYGERAVDFLFPGSTKSLLIYKGLFCLLAIVGAVWTLGPVLAFSDIMLGLMVVPNLFAVWMLFPKLRAASKEYFDKLNAGQFTVHK